MNKLTMGTRKTPQNYSNKKIFGIHMSRFGASWLNAGGSICDSNGFIIWMMNIPFKNEKNETVYISQDDAEDAYWMMSCGKFELQCSVRDFQRKYGLEKDYVKLPKDIYM